MARKKRQPDGDSPKKRRRKAPSSEEPLQMPDPRLMEGMLRELMGGMGGGPRGDSPEARAHDLLDQAYQEENEQHRVQLARQALEVWPDCADAYTLLAEQTSNRKEALRFYEQAVAAGERAVGPRAFQEGAGHFWGILETRPYMRARLGLAHTLWVLGRRDEAVRHLQDMLRLNPNDNQGIRYTLAGFLLFLDRDEDLERLLNQYPDEESAAWAYTRALLAFRREGDTPGARKLLKQARKVNKFVPDYLLGRKFPPQESPNYYSPGAESEALEYIQGFLSGWKSTPGAIAWLRANEPKKRKRAEAEPHGPLPAVKKWLKEKLSQEDDGWQADFQPMPNWIEEDGVPVRPWVLLVLHQETGQILAHRMAVGEPTAAAVWDTLVEAMQHPLAGEAHRPAGLEVRADDRWEELRPHLAEVGIELETAEELEPLQSAFQDLFEHLGGKPRPGLLDVPGVRPELVGGFYDAAASFYERAPWKKVGYESAIQVACDKFEGGPWYAVLMGQSGLTMGVALYEDLDTLRRMWAGDGSDEENARETVATSVTFGEESEIPLADLDAARRHGWRVARPDAYPGIFHKERGMSMRPPLAWELELVEGCLRAIPDFVDRRPQDDPTPETMTVPTAAGPLNLVLSWVVDI